MALKSLYFQNVKFEVTEPGASAGETLDVSCSGRGVTLTPDTPIEDRTKLCGKGKAVGETSWTADLDYDQDWDDPQGLSFYLFNFNGQEATTTITWPDALTIATATIIITPGPFGGTAGEVAEGTVSLPVLGQPTLAAMPPPVTATGATSGSPGSFTPSGATPPHNLTALQSGGIVASPTTAWTTGSHVVLGDTTHAHWSGTAWASGDAL